MRYKIPSLQSHQNNQSLCIQPCLANVTLEPLSFWETRQWLILGAVILRNFELRQSLVAVHLLKKSPYYDDLSIPHLQLKCLTTFVNLPNTPIAMPVSFLKLTVASISYQQALYIRDTRISRIDPLKPLAAKSQSKAEKSPFVLVSTKVFSF